MGEGSALRELLVAFGVEVDDKPLGDLEVRIDALKEGFTSLAKAAVSFFAVDRFKEMVNETTAEAAQIGRLAQQFGVTTEELDKFAFAAKMSGVDFETAAHSLGLFQRQMGEAVKGQGEAAKAFSSLGINIRDVHGETRSALDVMGDVSDKMQHMDPSRRAATAMQLFGRAGLAMVPILSKGREGLAELGEEFEALGGGFSDEFIQRSREYRQEQNKLAFVWTGIKGQIAGAILPYFKRFTEVLKQGSVWLRSLISHSHALEHLFKFVGLMAGVRMLWTLVGVLKQVALGEGLISLLNPFTLMIAGAAALYLVLDDLWTLVEGGDSLIGRALGPEKVKLIEELRGSFKQLQETWKNILPDLQELAKTLGHDLVEALPLLLKGFLGVLHVVENIVTTVTGLVDTVKALGSLNGNNVGEVWSKIKDVANNHKPAALREAEGRLNTPDVGGLESPSAPEFIRPPDMPTGSIRNSATSTIHQTNNISVDAKLPQGMTKEQGEAAGAAIGRGVTNPLQRHLGNALNSVKKL